MGAAKGPTVQQGSGGREGAPQPRVPVVRAPHERKEAQMMHRLHAMYQDNEKTKRKASTEQRATQQRKRVKEEAATAAASALMRKKRYVRMGMDARNASRSKQSLDD